MNEYILTGAVILGLLGVGFGLLMVYGVSEVVYFGIAVTAVAIFGALAYSWWQTKVDKTVETLKVDVLMKIRRDYAETKEFITQAGELTDVAPILRDLELLKEELKKLNLFEVEDQNTEAFKAYTLTRIEKENRKTDQKLRSLEALAAGEYKPRLDEYINNLRGALSKLQAGGYRIQGQIGEFGEVAGLISKSLREMLDKKKKLFEKSVAIIDLCITEAEEICTACTKLGDVASIDECIKEARANRLEPDKAVRLLVESRRKLTGMLKGTFEEQRTQLVSSLEEVLKLVQGEQVGAEWRAAVEGLLAKALSADDPGQTKELQGLEAQYKSKTFSLISELHGRINKLEEETGKYYDEKVWTPDLEIEGLVKSVSPRDELKSFTAKATEALAHLTQQLEKDAVFLKVIQSYAKVEPLIVKKLEDKGELKAAEFDVKYPDKFLALYSLKHQETTFTDGTLAMKKAPSKEASSLKERLLKKRKVQ